jgi:hypothetical protein
MKKSHFVPTSHMSYQTLVLSLHLLMLVIVITKHQALMMKQAVVPILEA